MQVFCGLFVNCWIPAFAGMMAGDGMCWNQFEFEADEEHGLVEESKTVARACGERVGLRKW